MNVWKKKLDESVLLDGELGKLLDKVVISLTALLLLLL